MDKDEALKLALRLCDEALPKFNWGASFLDANAIQLLNTVPAVIKAALAQPAQEPVAWISPKGHIHFDPYLDSVPLYTTPPKREWVGLTPEETSGFTSQEMTVVKYVSKVLQEKNHGA